MRKDSISRTLIVAFILCVVCSLLVSGAAVLLKDRQIANKELDIKKNLLLASGLLEEDSLTPENIQKAFEQIRSQVIELETGEVMPDMDPSTFDQKKAAKDPKTNKMIDPKQDYAGIKRRSKYAVVYHVMDGDEVKMLIFPVNGKGLWSTLYGFLAISSDFSEVQGIGFYEHAETPGLGGEVDNPSWKAKWEGKKIFDENADVIFRLAKGPAQNDYQVDGLSGATITANGVTGLVRYWFGEDGFGPYIDRVRKVGL